jgi:hypothetical protein
MSYHHLSDLEPVVHKPVSAQETGAHTNQSVSLGLGSVGDAHPATEPQRRKG